MSPPPHDRRPPPPADRRHVPIPRRTRVGWLGACQVGPHPIGTDEIRTHEIRTTRQHAHAKHAHPQCTHTQCPHTQCTDTQFPHTQHSHTQRSAVFDELPLDYTDSIAVPNAQPEHSADQLPSHSHSWHNQPKHTHSFRSPKTLHELGPLIHRENTGVDIQQHPDLLPWWQSWRHLAQDRAPGPPASR